MNKTLTLLFTCFVALSVIAQTPFRVMEYNVENLFDCDDDKLKNDDDFLEKGKNQWNKLRYRKKLADLSKVIMSVGGAAAVDVVALCEVENDSVLVGLTQQTRMKRLGYEYVVTNSDDVRGIDVALLYQPMRFKLLGYEEMVVPHTIGIDRPTRNILYASGRLQNGDTLDIFVAHLPSRRGGARATEEYRCRATRLLKNCADSLLQIRQNPMVIITGDFNDEPGCKSLSIFDGEKTSPSLRRKKGNEKIQNQDDFIANYALLSDTITALGGLVQGTYKYQGKWNRLDHMIVNKSLLSAQNEVYTSAKDCKICAHPFLVEEDTSAWSGVKPRRTYQGPLYHGGVSDHLPLVLTLWMKW